MLIVNDLDGGGKQHIGVFWVFIILIALAGELEGDVVVEGKGDGLIPLECMRARLSVLLLVGGVRLVVTHRDAPDLDRNDGFLEFYAYALQHQHQNNYILLFHCSLLSEAIFNMSI